MENCHIYVSFGFKYSNYSVRNSYSVTRNTKQNKNNVNFSCLISMHFASIAIHIFDALKRANRATEEFLNWKNTFFHLFVVSHSLLCKWIFNWLYVSYVLIVFKTIRYMQNWCVHIVSRKFHFTRKSSRWQWTFFN